MKPNYFTSVENCRSSIESAEQSVALQRQISSIFEDKLYKRIIESSISLYVYISANCEPSNVNQYIKGNNGVFVRSSFDLENDFSIIAITNRLVLMTLPESIQSCFIDIRSSEISKESKKEQENNDIESPSFIAQESKLTFDDVILPIDIKDRIIRALSIIKNRDLIFKRWGFEKIDSSTKSILCFYGAPGTGKTRTAQAIGNYLGKKIIFSTYADIESQWVGVGAKNLHAVFKAAEEQDAILFFDEADSFLSNRISNTSSSSDKHYNRMSNELFQLLEEFNGCVIFATNLLTDVDKAFKSRIIDSIRFELPDENARLEIIRYMIPDSFPLQEALSEDEWKLLVDISEGFSGRDIRKSVLLSLAYASTKFESNNAIRFSIDDLKIGFEEVKSAESQMDEEQNGFSISPEMGQMLYDKQLFNEKLVTMARLALNADEKHQANKAIAIYKEITRSILGVESDNYLLQVNDSINDVCTGVDKQEQKMELLDIAIKILTADGELSIQQVEFMKNILANFSVSVDNVNKVLSYAQSVASTNKEMQNLSQILFK